jgi:hypothetical protein
MRGRDRSHYDETRSLLTIECNSFTNVAEKSLPGSHTRRWASDPTNRLGFADCRSSLSGNPVLGSVEDPECQHRMGRLDYSRFLPATDPFDGYSPDQFVRSKLRLVFRSVVLIRFPHSDIQRHGQGYLERPV